MTNQYDVEALDRLKFEFSRISVKFIKLTFIHCKYYRSSHEILSEVDKINDDDNREKIRSIAPFCTNFNGTIILKTERSASDYIEELQSNKILQKEIDAVEAKKRKQSRDTTSLSPSPVKKKKSTTTKSATRRMSSASSPIDLTETEKDDDVGFQLECIECKKSCPIDFIVQCKGGHTFCSSCGKNSNVECKHCAPPPKEEEIDCKVCCLLKPFDEMVSCSEACLGLVCTTCLKLYAETQLYGNNSSKVDCIGSDGCCGSYPMAMFEKALPEGLITNIEKHRVRSEVAKLDLWGCPHCEWMADVEDNVAVVNCLGCQKKSCRMCKEEPHGDLSCQEAAAKKEEEAKSNARNQLAEEMTDAVARKCPGCKLLIMKDQGCNKMKCSCGVEFCYICRVQITDYTHFCQTFDCDHSNCGMCQLYSDTVEQDKKKRRELAEAKSDLGLSSPTRKQPKQQMDVSV